MEATSLKKKNVMTKSKLKKTIKNVVCRPDPVHWPLLAEEHATALFQLLSAHKIECAEFMRPPWKELKNLPKEKRPKPPKLEKVKGMLFGINETSIATRSNECSAIVIEAKVNPPTIVYPIIENCVSHKVPVVCVEGLRKFSTNNFGIPTSCLGIQKKFHDDIVGKITELHKEILKSKERYPPKKEPQVENSTSQGNNQEFPRSGSAPMDTDIPSPFLYRTSKKTRVFVPLSNQKSSYTKKEFIGQDFITFSNTEDQAKDSKSFMKMIVKRMSNNENRKKLNK